MTIDGDIYRTIRLSSQEGFWVGGFDAMASPCEILLSCNTHNEAKELTEIAAHEAWRIEKKFSRYRDDNIVSRINKSGGQSVEVDNETGQLLDFAFQCFELSEGLFDISSGVLRRVWKFDGSANIPTAESVNALLPYIGLQKTTWCDGLFTLPEGMEIDLGGIGKEYAVDRTLLLLQESADIPMLVNFGGDIATNRCRDDGQPWLIGIEKPGCEEKSAAWVKIHQGGLATSGDAARYLMTNHKRYSHVLNPKTGWSVENAPKSVTVAAQTCTQAGILATIAMLKGAAADEFLIDQSLPYWLI
ncbi:MAG: thiamine biosynthesis lipoprotein [Oceanicoccus sp.]